MSRRSRTHKHRALILRVRRRHRFRAVVSASRGADALEQLVFVVAISAATKRWSFAALVVCSTIIVLCRNTSNAQNLLVLKGCAVDGERSDADVRCVHSSGARSRNCACSCSSAACEVLSVTGWAVTVGPIHTLDCTSPSALAVTRLKRSNRLAPTNVSSSVSPKMETFSGAPHTVSRTLPRALRPRSERQGRPIHPLRRHAAQRQLLAAGPPCPTLSPPAAPPDAPLAWCARSSLSRMRCCPSSCT